MKTVCLFCASMDGLDSNYKKEADKIGDILLEHNYLSSAEKLIEFQSLYFEDQLIQKNIKNIKIYNILKNQNNVEELKIIKE